MHNRNRFSDVSAAFGNIFKGGKTNVILFKNYVNRGICAGELNLVGAYIKGNAEILNKH